MIINGLFVIYILCILIMIKLQAFFSGVEMSLISADRIKIQHLAEKQNKNAKIIIKLLKNPNILFSTTLIGVNVSLVLGETIASEFTTKFFSEDFGHFISVMIMAPLIILFAEIIPMSIARKAPNTIAFKHARQLTIANFVLYPFIFLLSRFIKLIDRSEKTQIGDITKKELYLLFQSKLTKISGQKKQMIKEVFNFSESLTQDVMVHLIDIKASPLTSTVKEVKELIANTGFSRIPLYDKHLINVIGTVHASNLLDKDDKDPINKYIDKPYIIPETKPISETMDELRKNRKYMGIVVNEYGEVSGIITLEDIFELIVGAIEDEYDQVDEKLMASDFMQFEGRIRLEELKDDYNIDLTNEDCNTLGGFICLLAGRIPQQGEKFHYKNFEFTILESSQKTVNKIKIFKKHI